MATFGQRLRELRNTKDLSQDALAKHIGISKSSINMYERGEREPSFETLESIADYFNVDMNYLLGQRDELSMNGSAKTYNWKPDEDGRNIEIIKALAKLFHDEMKGKSLRHGDGIAFATDVMDKGLEQINLDGYAPESKEYFEVLIKFMKMLGQLNTEDFLATMDYIDFLKMKKLNDDTEKK